MNKRRNRRRAGITLIEMLIAVAVFEGKLGLLAASVAIT